MNKNLFELNFHHFMQLEENYNNLEIAEELGISIGEVNILKKRISRA